MLKVLNRSTIFRLSRSFYISSFLTTDENQGKPKRKIIETVELITLVDNNDKILGLKPKSDSEKLARKLNFVLERVTDPKYGSAYPAFKMMSTTELLKAEKKATNAKTLKKLPINSRITDHDLKTKIQVILKWIGKNSEVHVAISGKDANTTLAVCIAFLSDI